MDNILDIAYLNPVRFVEMNKTQSMLYNTKHFDEWWFEELILSFQEQVKFSQKWQTNDTIHLQLYANFDPISLTFTDCDGREVPGFQFVTELVNTTNNEPFFYRYGVDISLADLPEGYYYIIMTAGSGDYEKKYISDRIDVRINHPNTILLQCTNNRNRHGVIFNYTDGTVTFGLRVDAVFSDFTPLSDDADYTDQRADLTLLSSTPFRQWKMIFGDARGIPDPLADKINRYFSCTTVLIDSKQFVKASGAKMERVGDRLYPMAGWTLDVRESRARSAERFSNAAELPGRKISLVYLIQSFVFGTLNGPASSNTTQLTDIK